MAHRIHELSDAELNAYGQQFGPLFGGAVLDGELPALDGKFWFCLMTRRGSTNGHWTLTYDCDPARVIFVDSMGVAPTTLVHNRMLETGKPRQYSNLDEQGLPQIDCGYVVAFCAKRLVEGATLQHILREELHPLQFAANQRLVSTLRPPSITKSSPFFRVSTSSLSSMPARKTTGGRVRKHHGGKAGGKVRGGRCGGKTVSGGHCKNMKATCPHKH